MSNYYSFVEDWLALSSIAAFCHEAQEAQWHLSF